VHADPPQCNRVDVAERALALVDCGVRCRLDRQTRYYLADMLVGFLTGDDRRVAEVHFDAGYVPKRRSIDAFTQACRSIGEPILGRPLHEISIARLLAQLFQVTEQFEMETQPQLLLLQKTMVLIEGVGRRLDPEMELTFGFAIDQDVEGIVAMLRERYPVQGEHLIDLPDQRRIRWNLEGRRESQKRFTICHQQPYLKGLFSTTLGGPVLEDHD